MAEKFRSYMGPGDKDLPRANEVQGYQPVSRIGEVVMNAFVDAYEHQVLKGGTQNDAGDEVPAFYEWATIQPGMLTLARKKRTAQYRQFHAAETAMPVIGCAACLTPKDEKDYFFSGVCRSKTVRTPDDGIGPTVDEVRRAIRSARNASSLPRSPTHRVFPRAVLHVEFGGYGDTPQHVEREHLRGRSR